MKKKTPKTRKITDGVELLERRYVRNDPDMQKLVDEEFQKLEIGQRLYGLEREAMASPSNPNEQSIFDQVLKITQDLVPEAQEQLIVEMKLQWLRRALDEGEKDSAEGRTVSLEELNQHLDSIHQEIVKRQK